MTELELLLARFIEDWNAGRRPEIEDFVAQASESEREVLVDQIGTFLAFAPTPRFDETTLDELLLAPAVEAAVQTFAAEASAWPTLLPRLRTQAGLSLRGLASRILAAAGMGDGGLDKTQQRLAEMERGELDATRVSTRVVELVSCVLGVKPADLVRTGTPASAADALYHRGAEGDLGKGLDVVADALAAPLPAGEWDDVDELFFGGT